MDATRASADLTTASDQWWRSDGSPIAQQLNPGDRIVDVASVECARAMVMDENGGIRPVYGVAGGVGHPAEDDTFLIAKAGALVAEGGFASALTDDR